jgi:hypothetical protein
MPRIIYINHSRGMAVVEIDKNECSVIEADPSDLSLGDTVEGEFSREGSTKIKNASQGTSMHVIVQNASLTQEHAIRRANLQ